jgi:hypothetical protein
MGSTSSRRSVARPSILSSASSSSASSCSSLDSPQSCSDASSTSHRTAQHIEAIAHPTLSAAGSVPSTASTSSLPFRRSSPTMSLPRKSFVLRVCHWLPALTPLAVMGLLFIRIRSPYNSTTFRGAVITSERWDPLPPSSINKMQTAPNGRAVEVSRDSNAKPITQISILGERNSGTRWTYEYVVDLITFLTDCVAIITLSNT